MSRPSIELVEARVRCDMAIGARQVALRKYQRAWAGRLGSPSLLDDAWGIWLSAACAVATAERALRLVPGDRSDDDD